MFYEGPWQLYRTSNHDWGNHRESLMSTRMYWSNWTPLANLVAIRQFRDIMMNYEGVIMPWNRILTTIPFKNRKNAIEWYYDIPFHNPSIPVWYKPKSQSIPVAVHVVPDLQRQLIELGALAGTPMCGATYQGQCILDLEIAQQTMESHRKMVGKWWFNGGLVGIIGVYPLVIKHGWLENHRTELRF